MGKLSDAELKKLLSCIGRSEETIIPPLPGFDSGVHKIGDQTIVISTDPCINAPLKWFGWLLVNYAASDVALFGVNPRFCAIDLLGPSHTTAAVFLKVMRQACKAAENLGVDIVTGHTGTYDGLSTLVGTCAAYGIADTKELVTPRDAQPGDRLLCVKWLGQETVTNLAVSNKSEAERIFGINRVKALARQVCDQTCVREALLLSRNRLVHAMHDATEGGLVAAINEMAEASNLGFTLDFEAIPMLNDVDLLKQYYGLSSTQLLSLSSTGTFIAAADSKSTNAAIEILRENDVNANAIGVFTRKKSRILNKDGEETEFPRKPEDPYAKILSGAL